MRRTATCPPPGHINQFLGGRQSKNYRPYVNTGRFLVTIVVGRSRLELAISRPPGGRRRRLRTTNSALDGTFAIGDLALVLASCGGGAGAGGLLLGLGHEARSVSSGRRRRRSPQAPSRPKGEV